MPSVNSFWTQTKLLLWKSWLEKRRRPFSTLSEILLPLGFVLLVIWLQTLDPDKELEKQAYTCPRQSAFSSTLFIPQPKGENFFLALSTEGLGPGVQTVPPFLYLLLLASKTKSLIAITPGQTNDLALNENENKEIMSWIEGFRNDLDKMTEDLNSRSWKFFSTIFDKALEFEFCSFSKLSKIFASAQDMKKYIKSNDYGNSTWDKGCPDPNTLKNPKLHLALVVNKVGYTDGIWDYTIQTNMSIVPQTYPQLGYINKVDAGVDNRWNDMYMMSGFLTMQLMVDRYIINKKVVVDEDMERLARQQLCDSLDPFVKNFNASIAPNWAPLIKNFSCMKALDRAIKTLHLSTKPLTEPMSYIPNDIRMAQFPTEAYTDREFYLKIENVFALILILTFLWPVSRLVRGIVHEKETRLREGMRMMGLHFAPLYAAWFITYGVIFFLVALSITVATHPHLFGRSDPSLVFVYFFLFGLDIIGYCFLISVLFNKAKTASIAGVTLFFMGFFAYFAVASDNASAHAKASSCVLAPTAFGIGASILARYEGAGVGVTWSNFHETPNETQISFAHVLGSMLFDLGFYLFLSYYLDNVIQQEFGIRRPWYFLCTPHYWIGSTSRTKVDYTALDEDLDEGSNVDNWKPVMEEVTSEMMHLEAEGRCVKLQGLRKVFNTSDGKHVAVRNMNLDMYEGQIFVLLGHNGAGKTTLVSMLTGLIPPTKGTATVYGNDIRNDMDELRTMLGVCPQYDVLFDDLTVREHLLFFARLKGVANPGEEADLKIMEVGLEDKSNDLSSQLSGGQKRKLSVAIALIGDSKIIFLDEPTSRMDVWARRHTWNLLQNNKNGRIIVLTTHFMDEADILGDRIAIMADGGLECVGSSLFLKSKYGVGYTITFIQSENASSSDNKKKQLLAAIQKYAPEARVLSDVGAEISVQLPLQSAQVFPQMFADFDANMNVYGIAGYGASVTTLEEVFMKVGEGAEHFKTQTKPTGEDELRSVVDYSTATATETRANQTTGGLEVPLLNNQYDDESVYVRRNMSEFNIFTIHFQAMFLKRFNFAKRDKKAMCCNTFLPVLLLVLGLTLLKVFPLKEAPPLELNVKQFKQSVNVVPYNTSSLDTESQRWSRDLFSNYKALDDTTTTFLEAKIPRGMINTCSESNGSDIPDGSNLRGLSEWLLDHAHDNYTSMFGGIQINKIHQNNGNRKGQPFEATILTNSTSFHGPGIFLNLLNRAILHKQNNGTIRTWTHPFPFTAKFEALLSSFTAVSAAIIIMIAFSFVPAAITIFIVKEREIAAKHQQMISGASIYAYWSASYTWDMCMYMVPWVSTCFFVRVFGVNAFQGENLLPVCLLFLGYGFAAIPFTYCLSYLFKSHSTAQNLVLLINFLTGLVLMIASFVMSAIESTHSINKSLKYIYRLFPGFCLGNGLLSLTIRSSIKEFGSGIIEIESPYSWNVIGADLTYLLASGFVYFVITIIIDLILSNPKIRDISAYFRSRSQGKKVNISDGHESGNERRPLSRTSSSMLDVDAETDEDVSKEIERVESGDAVSDMMVVDHLRKVYGNGKEAVKDLTFGVPAGECFGFLGTNGAGKTTTLKIITGDILPTSGTAHLNGLNILTEQNRVRRLIGYCPQFDALLEHLTCREHLELFARLKCISSERLEGVVQQKLHEMNLKEFEHKTAGTLSGGNKRKLSVAISLIGDPSIIFLDEPSGPMDVINRRFMWDVISRITNQKDTTVILTSHSMEECEALCTRVGIMVEGLMKCIGPIQHLKSRFGKGLIVQIKIASPTTDSLQRALAHLRGTTSDKRNRSSLGVVVETFSNQAEMSRLLQLAPAQFPEDFFVEVVHSQLDDQRNSSIRILPGMVVTLVNDISLKGVPFDEAMGIIKNSCNSGRCALSFEGDTRSLSLSTSPEFSSNEMTPNNVLSAADLRDACGNLGDESWCLRFTEDSPDPSSWAITSSLSKQGTVTQEALCEWWLHELSFRLLEDFFVTTFSVVECLERRGEHTKWRVEGTSLSLGQIFELLETNKQQLRITEYSVTQATLEQIFVYFASQQESRNRLKE